MSNTIKFPETELKEWEKTTDKLRSAIHSARDSAEKTNNDISIDECERVLGREIGKSKGDGYQLLIEYWADLWKIHAYKETQKMLIKSAEYSFSVYGLTLKEAFEKLDTQIQKSNQ